MLRRRNEHSSTGYDDFLALAGSDGAGSPEWSGLRVPGAPGFRYRFLLCVCDLNAGDRIIGLGQYLELIALVNSGEGGAPPFYPFTKKVTQNMWRFIDGATCWTLSTQRTPPSGHNYDPLEQRSFMHRDASTPALVYETAGFPALPPEPGYLGLNAYTPPPLIGEVLFAIRDLRFPWESNGGVDVTYEADGAERVRFYVDVLQTNPATRFNPSIAGMSSSFALAPEDVFVLGDFPTLARYGRVAGRVLIERRLPAQRVEIVETTEEIKQGG